MKNISNPNIDSVEFIVLTKTDYYLSSLRSRRLEYTFDNFEDAKEKFDSETSVCEWLMKEKSISWFVVEMMMVDHD